MPLASRVMSTLPVEDRLEKVEIMPITVPSNPMSGGGSGHGGQEFQPPVQGEEQGFPGVQDVLFLPGKGVVAEERGEKRSVKRGHVFQCA